MLTLKVKYLVALLPFMGVCLLSSAKGGDGMNGIKKDSACMTALSVNVSGYQKEIESYVNAIELSKNIDTIHKLAVRINFLSKNLFNEVDSIKNSNPAYEDDMTYMIYGAAFASIPGMWGLSSAYYALYAMDINTPSKISNCRDQLEDMKFFAWWMTKCKSVGFARNLNDILKHKAGILLSER